MNEEEFRQAIKTLTREQQAELLNKMRELLEEQTEAA